MQKQDITELSWFITISSFITIHLFYWGQQDCFLKASLSYDFSVTSAIEIIAINGGVTIFCASLLYFILTFLIHLMPWPSRLIRYFWGHVRQFIIKPRIWMPNALIGLITNLNKKEGTSTKSDPEEAENRSGFLLTHIIICIILSSLRSQLTVHNYYYLGILVIFILSPEIIGLTNVVSEKDFFSEKSICYKRIIYGSLIVVFFAPAYGLLKAKENIFYSIKSNIGNFDQTKEYGNTYLDFATDQLIMRSQVSAIKEVKIVPAPEVCKTNPPKP